MRLNGLTHGGRQLKSRVRQAWLERKLSVYEILWVALTMQYDATRVQEAKDITAVRVLEVASAPQRKFSPVRSINIIVGIILSFIVALIAVLITFVWEEMYA